jgi:hypothetical protein
MPSSWASGVCVFKGGAATSAPLAGALIPDSSRVGFSGWPCPPAAALFKKVCRPPLLFQGMSPQLILLFQGGAAVLVVRACNNCEGVKIQWCGAQVVKGMFVSSPSCTPNQVTLGVDKHARVSRSRSA